MKILALEDQPGPAIMLKALLRSLGHEVELVADGTTAWTHVKVGGFRVVVSDWQMLGIDGLELCRMIRKQGGDYVYFILISAQKITTESRRLALEAGVDDFLIKPVDPEEMGMRLHVAERIIGLTAQVRQLESFIPICSYCKKIRDDQKYWQEIESYFSRQQGTKFSHGVCPDCYARVVVPQLAELDANVPVPTANKPPLPPSAHRVN